METLNYTSIDIDLANIRDEIKLLLLRIKAMGVHKNMLLKQLNDVTAFGQQLNEELNRRLDKEIRLIKKKEVQTHQLIEVSHDRTKRKSVSLGLDDSLLSETNNEQAENVGLTEMKLAYVDCPRCRSCLLTFDNNDRLLEHNCVEHSLNSGLDFVSLPSKMIRNVIPGAIVPDNIIQNDQAQTQRYVCTVCGIFSTTKGNLDRHKRTNTCIQKCKSSGLNTASLDESVKIGKLPRYCCPVCRFSCYFKANLFTHMRNRGCEQKYKRSEFKSGPLPLKEFKIIPPKTVVGDKPVKNLKSNLRMYTCPVCHVSCSFKGNLLKHMRNKGCEERYLHIELNDASEPLTEFSIVLKDVGQDLLKEFSTQLNVTDPLKVSKDVRAETILMDYIAQNFKSKFPLYFCPLCHIDYSTKFNLLSHIRNKVCDLKMSASERKKSVVGTADYSELQRRLRNDRALPIFYADPNVDVFICYICRKKTKNKISGGRRRDTGKDICETCEIRLPELSRSRNNEDETIEKLFKCKFCNRSFPDRSLFLKHMRVHFAERPHMCTRCGKSYLTSVGLKYHMNIHDSRNLSQCEICLKTFHGINSLKNHMVLHSRSMDFVCSVCGKAFAFRHSLKVHMRFHTGERPYSCSYCDKTFTMSCHLRTHISSHTGVKHLICKVCDKRFRLHKALKKHMKIHVRKGELE